ncbi:hypothetical protein NC652_003204 [Populus alba x Populus x berolinensis]|nr:hypothetical protein NC652_003204 [Populus alba x Populus x berolinensis]
MLKFNSIRVQWQSCREVGELYCKDRANIFENFLY